MQALCHPWVSSLASPGIDQIRCCSRSCRDLVGLALPVPGGQSAASCTFAGPLKCLLGSSGRHGSVRAQHSPGLVGPSAVTRSAAWSTLCSKVVSNFINSFEAGSMSVKKATIHLLLDVYLSFSSLIVLADLGLLCFQQLKLLDIELLWRTRAACLSRY